jgi:hypothetical protein
MMQSMHHMVMEADCSVGSAASSHRTAALYDWVSLGLFTGHRLGEFGSALPSGSGASGFHPLPLNKHIPPQWRKKKKDFVRNDVSFYDVHLNLT